MTNAEFAASDEQFQQACELANIQPTRRQASKFRRETGLAYKALRFARINRPNIPIGQMENALEFAGLRRRTS